MADSTRILAEKSAALLIRAAVTKAIRDFFDAQGFLAVDTPVRLRAPALERHIDAEPSGSLFLRTSPELHMKQLLAAGYDRIYQLGPCFRRGEQGRLHHPEYTMLEWYRSNADYRDILNDTIALVRAIQRALSQSSRDTFSAHSPGNTEVAPPAHIAKSEGLQESSGGTRSVASSENKQGSIGGWHQAEPLQWQQQSIRLQDEWLQMTVQEAFQKWAGWDPVSDYDADRFDLDLIEKVEPALAREQTPVILMDYPAPAAALARRKPDQPEVAERWELYIGGIEIANAYSELTNVEEQRARFEQCAKEREAAGLTVYPLDEAFLEALPHMPPSGGIALGVDRLVMLFADCATLADITAFLE